MLMLQARRFRCAAVLCERRIFTERFDDNILKPWARRTAQLDQIVHCLALVLGGRPAASFALRLSIPVSNSEGLFGVLAAPNVRATKTMRLVFKCGSPGLGLRQLQVLAFVPKMPLGGQPQDAFWSSGASHPMSHAQKPTSAVPMKGKDHISASPRNLEASSELTAQLADRSSDGSGRSSAPSSDGTAVSLGVPTANDVVADTGGTAPHPMAKPRVRAPITLDANPVPVAAKDRGFITRTDALGALPTAVDDVSRPKRKRTIMGRYVFGDELKPGERWKRHLSKGR